MNVCKFCRIAGDTITKWRQEGKKLTFRMRNELIELHAKCPGHASCFCQHRVSHE